MLIKSILYKFEENEDYILLPIRSMSGTINLTGEPVRQNFIEKAECSSYIPNISSEMKNILGKLAKLGGIFSIIDNSGNMHELGNDDFKAAITYSEKNEGAPGTKYGYDIKITFSSAVGIPVQSFTDEAS
jgi:hypothetical protein